MQAKLQEVSELDKELVRMLLLRRKVDKPSFSEKWSDSEAQEMMLEAIKVRNQSTAFLLCYTHLLHKQIVELKQKINAQINVSKNLQR